MVGVGVGVRVEVEVERDVGVAAAVAVVVAVAVAVSVVIVAASRRNSISTRDVRGRTRSSNRTCMGLAHYPTVFRAAGAVFLMWPLEASTTRKTMLHKGEQLSHGLHHGDGLEA